jgi:hypothetical protein
MKQVTSVDIEVLLVNTKDSEFGFIRPWVKI